MVPEEEQELRAQLRGWPPKTMDLFLWPVQPVAPPHLAEGEEAWGVEGTGREATRGNIDLFIWLCQVSCSVWDL